MGSCYKTGLLCLSRQSSVVSTSSLMILTGRVKLVLTVCVCVRERVSESTIQCTSTTLHMYNLLHLHMKSSFPKHDKRQM